MHGFAPRVMGFGESGKPIVVPDESQAQTELKEMDVHRGLATRGQKKLNQDKPRTTIKNISQFHPIQRLGHGGHQPT